MNERIRQLAEQANIKYGSAVDYFRSHATDGVARQDMEKFAELIVRECLDSIEHYKNTSITKQIADEGVYSYEQGCIAGMNEAVLIIKEHFGVEE